MDSYLPSYSMVCIFSFLDDPRDICKCSQVCKFWNSVSNDNCLWKGVCYRILPELAKQIPFQEYESMIRTSRDKTLMNVLPGYLKETKFKRTMKRRKLNGGPKRSMSGYMYFCQDVRAKVTAENPKMGFGDIGKEVADRWKKLIPAEKQKYLDRAAEDKKRYLSEKADYPARCKREEEAFYVQVATNPCVLFTLIKKLKPQPKGSNKRKRDQSLTQAEVPQQPANYKLLFQNQTKAFAELDHQVRQEQQCKFLQGLAFLFEINQKRQMMLDMMMQDSDDYFSDSDHYYDSSDDGGCFYGGPFLWSSDSDD